MSSTRQFVVSAIATVGWLVIAAHVVSCSSLPEAPPVDPAQAAHDVRVASERACNAYQAAVKAELIKPNAKADMSCRAVQAVCGEVAPAVEGE